MVTTVKNGLREAGFHPCVYPCFRPCVRGLSQPPACRSENRDQNWGHGKDGCFRLETFLVGSMCGLNFHRIPTALQLKRGDDCGCSSGGRQAAQLENPTGELAVRRRRYRDKLVGLGEGGEILRAEGVRLVEAFQHPQVPHVGNFGDPEVAHVRADGLPIEPQGEATCQAQAGRPAKAPPVGAVCSGLEAVERTRSAAIQPISAEDCP